VIDDHLLVETMNRARTVERLGMKCDAQEIPSPLDGTEPVGELGVVGIAELCGAVDVENNPTPDEQKHANVKRTAAITICNSQLLAIVPHRPSGRGHPCPL